MNRRAGDAKKRVDVAPCDADEDSCRVVRKLRALQALTERTKAHKVHGQRGDASGSSEKRLSVREFKVAKFQSAEFRRWSSLA